MKSKRQNSRTRTHDRRILRLCPLKNQRGQGLIEYLILVALMGVATIAIVRTMGQNVSAKFASITYALQGERRAVRSEAIDESQYKRKDLGNFFDGVGSGGGNGRGGSRSGDADR